MGDEDWDTELTAGTTSFVPHFSKLENVKEKSFNYNQSSNFRDGDDEFRKSDAPSRSGFGAGRGFGNQRGGDDENKSDTSSRTGFGSGRVFGSQKNGDDENKSDTSSRTGFGSGRGFGSQKSFRDGNVEGGFGDRNIGSGGGHSEDGFGDRRGRGIGRGMRGGFGRNEDDEEQHQTGNFGSKFGFGRQTRTEDDEDRGRGGFSGRGGYKGRNEDVGSGKGPLKSDEERESGEALGPKVTYVPPPPPETEDTIFAHYQTGINFDKYDKILVEVTGREPPPAILTFEEANLCETLNKNISKAGYIKLTPVQKYSIPVILAGRDLMACAQTGSGKTAAFLLPILAHMMRDGITATSFTERQEPEAIIVAPTRELINQIYLDARKFAYGTCVRPVVIYGGTQTFHSIRQISQGCNILCATPGRLIDIINRGKIGLTKLQYLVLDEADRMLDMGFGPDMKKLISSPGMPSKEERQTLMFSATFPEDIQRMAGEFLKSDYLFVAVGQVGGACTDVEQRILEISQFEKKDKLIEILNGLGEERTMVFVGTKKKADYLTTLLCQEKVLATSIHGDRLQKEREEALYDFRSGKCTVLVATNVAARGLDIENVQHVINFDLSDNIDEYVHRIGRTGRCGNVGKAITFFDSSQDSNIAHSLVKVLSDAQQEVPLWLEEIAFSARGASTFSSSRGTVFASVDSRKDGAFNSGNHSQASFSTAADDDASWD